MNRFDFAHLIRSALILIAGLVVATSSSLAAETLGRHPSAIVSGDLNSDGHLDLVVANYNSDYFSVLLGDGHGGFGPQRKYFVESTIYGSFARSLALADFNRDGKLDLAVGLWHGVVRILLGRGDGSFNPFSAVGGGFITSVAALDFNADGNSDLVESTYEAVSFYLGRGDGTFVPDSLPFLPDAPPFQGSIEKVTFGDFDRDGQQDIAAAYTYDCRPPRELGCNGVTGGFGVFSRKSGWRTYDFGPWCNALVAGDFNRDGKDDLLVSGSTNTSRGTRWSISQFMGDSDPWGGGEGFSSLGVVATEYTSDFVTADFNGDGFEDVATPYIAYQNKGNGQLVPSQYLSTSDLSASVVASGDFDSDGNRDLAVADAGKDSLFVWLGKGDGTFLKVPGGHQSLHAPIAAVGAAADVECGDLVRLDGRDSTDVDSTAGNDDIILFEWFESYDSPNWKILGTGEVLETLLPLGTHRITLRVMDSGGNTSLATVTVHVTDTTAPAITLSLSPALLWPPNHKMIDVTATVLVSDACGPARVSLDSIASSEPDGEDIQGASLGQPDFSFQLRAEHDSSGQGRTYTVVYLATDASGQTTRASAVVKVPLSLSPQP